MHEYRFIPFPKTDAERVVFRQRLMNEVLTDRSSNEALLSRLAQSQSHLQEHAQSKPELMTVRNGSANG